MIIRSVTRSALCGTVALATGLLVLLPVATPAAADAGTDPVVRAPGLPGAPAVAGTPASAAPAASASPGAGPAPAAPAAPADGSLLYRPGTQVRAARGAPALPDDVSALSWLVADARTGAVLAAHNAHLKLPPASTLKTLFAVTTLPHLPQHAQHTVSEAELDDIGPGSSLVGIVPGQSYEVADLWRGVFLSSGNDAVRALAEMNGGWDKTVTQMREKAKLLGALDTHVVSPDGYDAPGQVTSAYDLAVFGRTGLASPDFVRYSSTVDAQFPGDGGGTFGIINTNRLLSGEDGIAPYPGLIGVKNGYTSDAGYTLVAAARHHGRTLLVTVMNPQAGGGSAVYEEARSLLDWGFAADRRVAPVGSLQPPAPPLPPLPPVSPDETAPAGATKGPVARALRTAPAGSAVPAAKVAEAGATGTGEKRESSDPLAFALIGGACLAALWLFLVRRSARRRERLG
ncbi:D-alanyl-D-alanine carboxypeptidase family protein [Streptomyces corynorhini]|uniref:D-alanyl-D-alanine carboxypeptidase n=1 Tax=Streptomyces corynorhini TaxID=2282652 RepID=A0A370BD10_9ACTN|nr:D-alanyl-D-alanine carboxypeptidase [Streptomyces corynorhini]RDG39657.1 D-alanyl-D-alanine carboxypeptidase [Streptomyces corynorhini]